MDAVVFETVKIFARENIYTGTFGRGLNLSRVLVYRLRTHKRYFIQYLKRFSFNNIAAMPPARRRSKSTNPTPTTNGDIIASLRQKCADKGLPTHGRQPVLVSVWNTTLNHKPKTGSHQNQEIHNLRPRSQLFPRHS